jgi:magnesium-protoporphyrin IX monomethyl ester (oxidative) cyclase
LTPVASVPLLREDLLTQRFTTTQIDRAARPDLEADDNRDQFDRQAILDRPTSLHPQQKTAYGSELARHASFLNRAQVAEGIQIDLPALSGTRPTTWFPFGWVLYSVYLSENIGHWRYILIDRHLKSHPDQAFAPLFAFLEPWCQDAEGHGDIFILLIRCWPGLDRDLRGRPLRRIFLWSVFLTPSLTVCERGDDYVLLGLEAARFDEDVIRHTNRTARRAIQAAKGQPLRQLGTKARFAALLPRQALQPMEPSHPSAH